MPSAPVTPVTPGDTASSGHREAVPLGQRKLSRKDWNRICVNTVDHRIGRPYRASTSKANCRLVTPAGSPAQRRFVVAVPPGALRRDDKIPVVVFFHGTSGTGEQYWNVSRFRELAKVKRFIAVFPSALAYRLTPAEGGGMPTKWVDYGQPCRVVDPSALADDVAFVDAILRDLRRQLPIDRRRVFAAGFSNGGQFVARLAAERSRVFAAAGDWAGSMSECALSPVDTAARPVPLLVGVGSVDDRYAVGIPEIPEDAATVYSAAGPQLDAFATSQQLQDSAWREDDLANVATVGPPIGVAQPATWAPVMTWDTPVPGNTRGNAFHFVVLRGLGHKFPNAWPGAGGGINRRSQGVTAARMFVDFFERATSPFR
ncbi:PHB depolymerase family esterase [Nocardioides dilutus]